MYKKGAVPFPFLTPSLWNDAPTLTMEQATGRPALSLLLADDAQTRWASRMVSQYHYLNAPVDPRCSALTYIVTLGGQYIGILTFGRPEATSVSEWYGSVLQKQRGECRLSRWEILNLARVWLSPSVQIGGLWYSPDILPGFSDRHGNFQSSLATTVIRMALEAVVVDYLIQFVPIWTDEPYQIREIISYCDPRYHRGVVYQQAGFRMVRENSRGLQTYMTTVRELSQGEDAYVRDLAAHSPRSKRYRRQQMIKDVAQGLLPFEGKGDS